MSRDSHRRLPASGLFCEAQERASQCGGGRRAEGARGLDSFRQWAPGAAEEGGEGTRDRQGTQVATRVAWALTGRRFLTRARAQVHLLAEGGASSSGCSNPLSEWARREGTLRRWLRTIGPPVLPRAPEPLHAHGWECWGSTEGSGSAPGHHR